MTTRDPVEEIDGECARRSRGDRVRKNMDAPARPAGRSQHPARGRRGAAAATSASTTARRFPRALRRIPRRRVPGRTPRCSQKISWKKSNQIACTLWNRKGRRGCSAKYRSGRTRSHTRWKRAVAGTARVGKAAFLAQNGFYQARPSPIDFHRRRYTRREDVLAGSRARGLPAFRRVGFAHTPRRRPPKTAPAPRRWTPC